MRVFVTKAFRRFQRKEGIRDQALTEAMGRIERGLADADLGHGLIKQRVARPGVGRSGGYRKIIAYRAAHRSVFLYGFAKSAQGNVSLGDQRDLADFGKLLLELDERGIEAMLAAGQLTEIIGRDEKEA